MKPLGHCKRYSAKEKKFLAVPQPNMNQCYNNSMGGVDLLDNSEKNYAITTRVKKWYWCLYTWFLNICMVQGWRLYRAHMTQRHRMAQVNVQNEQQKCRRNEEKKKEEIPLLDFMRLVVEMTVMKHAGNKEAVVSQKEASSTLAPGTLKEVKFDCGDHLIILTSTKGVCKFCKEQNGEEKRTKFRCARCNVALHAECFYRFHMPE